MTPELDAVYWLGPDIRMAADWIGRIYPGVMHPDQLAAAITEWLLDHNLVLEMESLNPSRDRAWWLATIGQQIVSAELREALNHRERI